MFDNLVKTGGKLAIAATLGAAVASSTVQAANGLYAGATSYSRVGSLYAAMADVANATTDDNKTSTARTAWVVAYEQGLGRSSVSPSLLQDRGIPVTATVKEQLAVTGMTLEAK